MTNNADEVLSVIRGVLDNADEMMKEMPEDSERWQFVYAMLDQAIINVSDALKYVMPGADQSKQDSFEQLLDAVVGVASLAILKSFVSIQGERRREDPTDVITGMREELETQLAVIEFENAEKPEGMLHS